MFDAQLYKERRTQLQQSLSTGLLLFLGNSESSRNYKDNPYRFRQDSSFLYYFGIDRPNVAALIDLDEDKTIFYGEERSIEEVIVMGPQPSLAEIAQSSGIQQSGSIAELVTSLQTAVEKDRKVHFLPPYRPHNAMLLSKWLKIPYERVTQSASKDFIKAIVAQRSIKSTLEVEELTRAVNISRAMHIAVMKAAKPGMKESQLVGILEGIALATGGDTAYPPILTINGQTLHNHYHGNRLETGRLVLGDFGAETASTYAGDITRTFPVDKTFSAQQKAIYQIVLNALNTAIEAIKPGAKYLDIHLLAARVIVDGLKELQLMKGDTEEAIFQGAHALFFPHGLGHMLGMDVHDMEDLGEDLVGYGDGVARNPQFGLKSLRLGKALQTGFVLTVEPGIYFIPELIDLWRSENKFTEFIDYNRVEAFRNFSGVRIEDDVLVTDGNAQILGAPIPKTVKEIEELRGA